jgi:hypothetical protein
VEPPSRPPVVAGEEGVVGVAEKVGAQLQKPESAKRLQDHPERPVGQGEGGEVGKPEDPAEFCAQGVERGQLACGAPIKGTVPLALRVEPDRNDF